MFFHHALQLIQGVRNVFLGQRSCNCRSAALKAWDRNAPRFAFFQRTVWQRRRKAVRSTVSSDDNAIRISVAALVLVQPAIFKAQTISDSAFYSMLDRGGVTVTTTGGTGDFVLTPVDPGVYRVEVTAAGFGTATAGRPVRFTQSVPQSGS